MIDPELDVRLKRIERLLDIIAIGIVDVSSAARKALPKEDKPNLRVAMKSQTPTGWFCPYCEKAALELWADSNFNKHCPHCNEIVSAA